MLQAVGVARVVGVVVGMLVVTVAVAVVVAVVVVAVAARHAQDAPWLVCRKADQASLCCAGTVRTVQVQQSRIVASVSADDPCRVLCVYRHHDHDGDRHDDHDGDRHHEHANHDTHHTIDNHGLQHSAEVQGIDDALSPRKLTVATFVSEYRGIGLRTVPVQVNLRVATFSADDVFRVLCVSRHYNHNGYRHDALDGDRHHEHANQDAHDTEDNHGLQHFAEVQGLNAVRCSRQLTVATFVSEYGCTMRRTVSVHSWHRNLRAASVSADDVLGVL